VCVRVGGWVCVSVRACVCACVRARVCACVSQRPNRSTVGCRQMPDTARPRCRLCAAVTALPTQV
jgi:hypothetical protein